MSRFLKKTIRITSVIFLVVFLGFIILINVFFKPESTHEIQAYFSEFDTHIQIDTKTYRNKKVRIISTFKRLDTTLPTIVFIHGSPGAAMDYKKYLSDSELNKKANLIAFDRVGYNKDDVGDIQSILVEAGILNEITSSLNVANTILVGYSYGGPVALASMKKYKKIVLCAPAVYGDVEPMFWFLNFYKWDLTRWMIPDLLKAASIEKLQHIQDLNSLEETWVENPSEILSIHGDKDRIVPYENSLFIKEEFPQEQFELVTLKEAGHDLIWSRFDRVKQELIKVIED